jgi:hypothetical protein
VGYVTAAYYLLDYFNNDIQRLDKAGNIALSAAAR